MTTLDPITAFVRRYLAQAAINNHAVRQGYVPLSELASALGRVPTSAETERASLVSISEWTRFQHADEIARVLGVCLTVDQDGTFYQCTADGTPIEQRQGPGVRALVGEPGFRWPRGAR